MTSYLFTEKRNGGPAAGWSFMAAFITTLLGLVWLPLGRVLGWVSFALVKYILWVARTLTALPPRRSCCTCSW